MVILSNKAKALRFLCLKGMGLSIGIVLVVATVMDDPKEVFHLVKLII